MNLTVDQWDEFWSFCLPREVRNENQKLFDSVKQVIEENKRLKETEWLLTNYVGMNYQVESRTELQRETARIIKSILHRETKEGKS